MEIKIILLINLVVYSFINDYPLLGALSIP